MSLPLKIILFFLSNVLGFFAAATLFIVIITTGMIDLNAENFDPNAFREWFLPRVMASWVICALFSISGFFIGGLWRLVFFIAPAVVPFVYGLSLILAVR